MAIDQSQIQRLLEATSGVQNQAQQNQPAQPNNGNPNTINNTAAPMATQNPNWMLPVQSNAAGQWWAPAPLQMPSGGTSSSNTILDNIRNRTPGTGGFPGTGTPLGPPVTPPTGTTPTNPYSPPGWSGPDFIGPISGPVTNNPHNFSGNFNLAQPNTNLFESGLGRQYSMDWLRMGFQGGNTNNAWGGVMGRDLPSPDTEQGQGFWTGMWGNLRNMATTAIRQGLGNLSDWRQILDIVSEPFIPGDWYNSETGEWNNPLEASGITGFLSRARTPMSEEQQQALLNQSLGTAQNNMNSQRDEIINRLMSRFSGHLSSEESRRRAEEIYNNAPEMSRQEWQRTQESMNWNNFWNSRGQGTTRNPVTGLPSQDLIDDMINQMQERALNWTVQMRDRWTRQR